MPDPTIFGQRLREMRELREWTQEELAEKAGLAPSVVSHYETGVRKKPSADNLVKLAKALDVTVDYLLGRTPLPEVCDERVAALLRSLAKAPSERYEDFLNMWEWFSSRGMEKPDEPPGADGTEESG